jgi:hypothetical protein
MQKPINDTKNNDNKNNRNDGTFKITGDWAIQSELLKDKFPQLTDADLKFSEGEEMALLERVETKLNKKRGEVINIIRKGEKA